MAEIQHSHSDKPRKGGRVANILAIVGSAILIVIIIWGLIHLLSLSGSFFSSLFGGSSSGIEVKAPAEVTSGQSAQISWTHKTREGGMYALLYPCTEGLRFSTPAPNGSLITMPCGAAFAIGPSTSTARIMPMLTGSGTVKTAFSVLFIPSSTSTKPTEGTVTMNVKPGAPVQPQPEVKEQTPVTPKKPTTPTYPGQSGPADLAVTITSVSIDQWGGGTVTFNISNVGSGTSGAYSFTAQLPTFQPYTYVSTVQSPLSPGSHIANTLRFTQATPGTISIVLSATDANTSNNSAVRSIGSTYPYNYRYGY